MSECWHYSSCFSAGSTAWYVVGGCLDHGDERTLRASRIRSLRRTGEHFERPLGFSLGEYFSGSWEVFTGDPVKVRVRFTARIAPLVEEMQWRPGQKIRRHRDGRITFAAEFPRSPELNSWILGWGSDAEVLSPKSLRTRIAGEAKKMAEVYP